MLCSNCGENLPNAANFCSKCGVPIPRPTEIPQVPFPWEGDCPITASGMVYLFADQFFETITQLSFVEKAFIHSWSTVPCTDMWVKPSTPALMAAAFIWLEENGLVTLSIGKGILLHDSVIAVRKMQISHFGPASLESRIWAQMTGRMDKDGAYDLTYRVVGHYSDPYHSDPKWTVIRLVRNHLLEEGYFLQKKRWRILTELVPDCRKIAELRECVEGTRSMISSFSERKPTVYCKLLREVRRAYTAISEPTPLHNDYGPDID